MTELSVFSSHRGCDWSWLVEQTQWPARCSRGDDSWGYSQVLTNVATSPDAIQQGLRVSPGQRASLAPLESN